MSARNRDEQGGSHRADTTQGEKKLVFVTFGGDIVQHGDGQFRQQVETGGTPRYLYWDSRAEWDIANLRIDRRLRQPARHT